METAIPVKIVTILGARPQFIKAAMVSREFAAWNAIHPGRVREVILHTGQHYDENMSAVFFSELGLPDNQFLAGLVGFNVGVEIGQLSVLLVALAITWPLRGRFEEAGQPKGYRNTVVLPGSLVIAATGAFWTVERVLAV